MTGQAGAFHGRRVLVTGHTGFKGSWLVLWLRACGAKVAGLALPAETHPNHWGCLALDIPEHHVDIRDRHALRRAIAAIDPEIVFHLAAQAYVRRSYREPVANWETNLIGTVNLLDACRQLVGLSAVVVISSDKCYRNNEWNWGYREIDPLGGHDPYSASKAAVELAVASYRSSFFDQPGCALLATARAGNVVGGGDWSEDRLIPDIVRAANAGQCVHLRSPDATRPWQHVLEAVAGYALLGEKLVAGDRNAARAWNFGPERIDNRTVVEVLSELGRHWPGLSWERDAASAVHEARLLNLDSTDAVVQLGWEPQWGFSETLRRVAEWYLAWSGRGEVLSQQQLLEYQAVHASRAHKP